MLSWLSSHKQLQPYVRTRVKTIKEIASSHTWRFCPTLTNPADLLTRGVNTSIFNEKKKLWFEGPPWLREPEERWPQFPTHSIHDESESTQMEITIKTNAKDYPNILNIINITRYSSLIRTLRITALVVHFTRKLRKTLLYSNALTAQQILEARNLLLKATQQTAYQREFSYLQSKDSSKQPAIVRQLNLFLDGEDLIRCRGRLQYTDLPHDTKFPILIPKNNLLTTLIVQSMHKMVMHGGVRDTLTQIRQTYWIPQGRQLVKKIISKCVTCRKTEGPPFRSVPTPPLPKSRVQQSQAFEYTGIDYAGPLYVRNHESPTSSKVYICLFTCAAIRALHLELVGDQTTQAFLQAFRRFISRRGVPKYIISDNAKTFKAGAQELQTMKTQLLEANASQQFLADHNITWKFITERAPWWGGFYERLIGLVKRCLKKTIGKACLSWTELNTILTEVEAVLNSRPLTYPYMDINDASPLTPSHFLCGHRILTLPDTKVGEKEVDPEYLPSELSTKKLIKRARYYETVIQAFWVRWKMEYLTSLREHHSHRKIKSNEKVVAKGDVVLVHDNVARNQWKVGVVTNLHTGKDGLVRSVSLRISSGKELSRPIEKLYPLEVSEESDERSDQGTLIDKESRPVRFAAQKAMKRIREQSTM